MSTETVTFTEPSILSLDKAPTTQAREDYLMTVAKVLTFLIHDDFVQKLEQRPQNEQNVAAKWINAITNQECPLVQRYAFAGMVLNYFQSVQGNNQPLTNSQRS